MIAVLVSCMDLKTKILHLRDIAKKVAIPILKEQGKIRVISHYDADGISAGAIMYKTLKYLGKNFEISFVSQLEEDTLKNIDLNSQNLLIFTDLGSGQLDLIEKYLSKIKVVVVDHHQPVFRQWSGLYHLNCHLVDLDGKVDISGAGMAYILARELSLRTKNLVELAIVGAVGDRQKKKDKFYGVNKVFLDEAEYSGMIKKDIGLRFFGRYTRPIHKCLEYSLDPFIEGISGNESASVQFLSDLGIPIRNQKGSWRKLCDLTKNEEKKLTTALVMESLARGDNSVKFIGPLYKLSNDYDVSEFSTLLNACGRLEQPIEGVKLCIGDRSVADDIQLKYRKRLAKYMSWISKNQKSFRVTDKATYIVSGDHINFNFLGPLISIALKKYVKTGIVLGFSNTSNGVKISSRSRDSVDTNLGNAIRVASAKVGGVGGGHSGAAGGKIPLGSEDKFIDVFDSLL